MKTTTTTILAVLLTACGPDAFVLGEGETSSETGETGDGEPERGDPSETGGDTETGGEPEPKPEVEGSTGVPGDGDGDPVDPGDGDGGPSCEPMSEGCECSDQGECALGLTCDAAICEVCPTGSEGCFCYPDQTCDAPFTCSGFVCK